MRQVSEEAIAIFDFIIELYHSCSGDWGQLRKQAEVQPTEMEEFLTYAATFLSNVGNYYVYLPQYFFRVLDYSY
jgi:dipeptidyl-peptidase III